MASTPHPTTSGATVPTPPVFAGAEAETARGAAETVAARDAMFPNNPVPSRRYDQAYPGSRLDLEEAAAYRATTAATAKAQAALQGPRVDPAGGGDTGLASVAERKRLRGSK